MLRIVLCACAMSASSRREVPLSRGIHNSPVIGAVAGSAGLESAVEPARGKTVVGRILDELNDHADTLFRAHLERTSDGAFQDLMQADVAHLRDDRGRIVTDRIGGVCPGPI